MPTGAVAYYLAFVQTPFELSVMLFYTAPGLALANALVTRSSLPDAGCQHAISGLPDAACINANALFDVFAAGPSGQDFDPDVYTNATDKWETGMCAAPPCSSDVIVSIQQVLPYCPELDTLFGFSSNNLSDPVNISATRKQYLATRRVSCLKDIKQNELCRTVVARSRLSDSNVSVADLVCNACNKETYNIANEIGISVNLLDIPVNISECGSNFIDGKSPADVQETAVDPNGDSTSGSSGAAQTRMVWGASLGLLVGGIVSALVW